MVLTGLKRIKFCFSWTHCTKKWCFPVRISLVNVTKPAVSFFVQWYFLSSHQKLEISILKPLCFWNCMNNFMHMEYNLFNLNKETWILSFLDLNNAKLQCSFQIIFRISFSFQFLSQSFSAVIDNCYQYVTSLKVQHIHNQYKVRRFTSRTCPLEIIFRISFSSQFSSQLFFSYYW